MQLAFQATEAFARWAISLSGMAGGNPESDLWFCGIEPGGNNNVKDVMNGLADNTDVDEGIPYWGKKYREKFNGQYTRWQYMQKIAKLACAYEDQSQEAWREYLRDHACQRTGSIFLMNLYPFSFPNTDHKHWSAELSAYTGLPNKTCYLAWCMQYRFPILRALLERYRPKTLICIGKSYIGDYQLAFGAAEIEEKTLTSGKICRGFFVNDKKTYVVVTPFFGQGLRNEDLYEIAAFARKRI